MTFGLFSFGYHEIVSGWLGEFCLGV